MHDDDYHFYQFYGYRNNGIDQTMTTNSMSNNFQNTMSDYRQNGMFLDGGATNFSLQNLMQHMQEISEFDKDFLILNNDNTISLYCGSHKLCNIVLPYPGIV